jgi:response regulator RpfG family c-di-GMP phosphodiesterase
MTGQTIRVLIVDDSISIREALICLLEEEVDIEVVGEATNGQEAIRCAKLLQPDIVLMDWRMPVLDGVKATKAIKKVLPSTRVIFLTALSDRDSIVAAASGLASAYLIKGASKEKIVEVIRSIYYGKSKKRALSQPEKEFFKHKELTEKLIQLEALIEAGKVFASSKNLSQIFEFVENILPRMTSCQGFLIQLNQNSQPFYWNLSEPSQKALTHFLTKKISLKNQPLSIYDLSDELPEMKEALKKDGFKSALFLPLKTFRSNLGTIGCFYSAYTYFADHELKGMKTLASQIALALEEEFLRDELKEFLINTITALSTAIEAKEPYLKGHSEGVAKHAVDIGKALSLSEEDINSLKLAGLLHDIGKIGVDDRVLKKPGSLNNQEKKAIQQHPLIGAKIIEPVKALKPALEAVLHHHERWDGLGYPSGLKRKEIPLFARILGLADAYNAMTTQRVYRRALSIEEAKKELLKQAGHQFDPDLVQVFLQQLQKASERAHRKLPAS